MKHKGLLGYGKGVDIAVGELSAKHSYSTENMSTIVVKKNLDRRENIPSIGLLFLFRYGGV